MCGILGEAPLPKPAQELVRLVPRNAWGLSWVGHSTARGWITFIPPSTKILEVEWSQVLSVTHFLSGAASSISKPSVV